MDKRHTSDLQRRELRNLGMMAGAGVILFFCTQLLISFVINVTPLRTLYGQNMAVRYLLSGAASVLSVGGVFYLVRLMDTRVLRIASPLPLRPGRLPAFILAIPAGFALCLSANYVSALVGVLTDLAGVELTRPEELLPSDPAGIAAYLISAVIIPPIVEEFAVRGVLMQPLLRYGKGFAIGASALVFGMMHGNPKQMIFAFLSGLVIGYFTASTGSLLTGAGIHLLNNAFAVADSYLVQAGQEVPAALLMAAAIGIGILCLIAYLVLQAQASGRERGRMSGGRWRYFLNLVFLMAVALMALNAAQYVRIGG